MIKWIMEISNSLRVTVSTWKSWPWNLSLDCLFEWPPSSTKDSIHVCMCVHIYENETYTLQPQGWKVWVLYFTVPCYIDFLRCDSATQLYYLFAIVCSHNITPKIILYHGDPYEKKDWNKFTLWNRSISSVSFYSLFHSVLFILILIVLFK